jgi:hypothetical protein
LERYRCSVKRRVDLEGGNDVLIVAAVGGYRAAAKYGDLLVSEAIGPRVREQIQFRVLSVRPVDKVVVVLEVMLAQCVNEDPEDDEVGGRCDSDSAGRQARIVWW